MSAFNMQVLYAFMMSLIWSVLIVMLLSVLRRIPKLYNHTNMPIILVLAIACVVRPFLVYEPPFAIEIRSTVIYPAIVDFFRFELFSIFNIAITVLHLFVVAWIVGAVFCATIYLIMCLRYKRWVSALITVEDARIEEKLEQIAGESYSKTRYRLLVTPSVETPAFYGIFTPTFLMPVADLTDEELDIVLRHEWNHYTGRDILIRNIVFLIRCLFWWNPLIHFLCKEVNKAQEYICDIHAIRHMTDKERQDYVLLSIAITMKLKQKQSSKHLQTAGYAEYVDSSGLYENRMRSLLFYNRKSFKWFRCMLVVFCLMTLVLSYVFILQPYYEPHVDDDDVTTIVTSSSSSSYLVEHEDGRYGYYVEGELVATISSDGLLIEPFSELPIISKGD